MDVRTTRRTGAAVLPAALLIAFLVATFSPPQAVGGELTRREHLQALTNDARAERGRSRLGMVDRLSRYAERHSQAMADRGRLFHSDGTTLQRVLAPYDWSIGGENVGVGGDVRSIQDAFMASKPHRREILRTAYDHMAVGIAREHDRLWVTVIFYG
jgi:uncharacterized protein YkwD